MKIDFIIVKFRSITQPQRKLNSKWLNKYWIFYDTVFKIWFDYYTIFKP